jgi:hypothetical protein
MWLSLLFAVAGAFTVVPMPMFPIQFFYPCPNFTMFESIENAIKQIHLTNTFHVEFVSNVSFPHVIRNGLSTICGDTQLQINSVRWDNRFREVDISSPKTKLLQALLTTLGLGPSLEPGIMNSSGCDSCQWLSLDDYSGLRQSFLVNVLEVY